MTKLILIFQEETDGETLILQLEDKDLREFVKDKKLHFTDYAVLKGEVIKGFDQKNWYNT